MNKFIVLIWCSIIVNVYGMGYDLEVQKDAVSNQQLGYMCGCCALNFREKKDLESHYALFHEEDKESTVQEDSETEEVYVTDTVVEPCEQPDNNNGSDQNNLETSRGTSSLLLLERAVTRSHKAVQDIQKQKNFTSKACEKRVKKAVRKRKAPSKSQKQKVRVGVNLTDKITAENVEYITLSNEQDNGQEQGLYFIESEESFAYEDSDVEILTENLPPEKKKKVLLYECDTCQKTFVDLSNLKAHERTHEKRQAVACKACKRTFAAQIYLDKHRCSKVSNVC